MTEQNTSTQNPGTQNPGTQNPGTQKTGENAPAPTVWPTLQAHDAPALIDFLVGLGFRRTAVYADGDQVAHAQLDWPEGGGIMLGSHQPTEAQAPNPWSREPGTAGCYVVTADPDALYAQVQASGVTIIRELQNEDYGNREFVIADPEGNLWSFGSYRGEPAQH